MLGSNAHENIIPGRTARIGDSRNYAREEEMKTWAQHKTTYASLFERPVTVPVFKQAFILVIEHGSSYWDILQFIRL